MQLPQDFFAPVIDTTFDHENRWGIPKAGDSEFGQHAYGWLSSGITRRYRLWGQDQNPGSTGGGQVNITPTPGTGSHNVPVSFEYISKSWLMPKNWTAGATVGATDWVNSGGNIYSHSSGTTNGTIPPNLQNAFGQEGGIMWLAITVAAWGGATVYGPGDYVTNGGNLYICTVGGTSGVTGPVGTTEATDETDGTVTWRYLPVTTWAAMTAYEYGDVVVTSGRYYRNFTLSSSESGAQTSGRTAPTWTSTTVSDGLITWTQERGAYEALVADTDICLFEDELMILGLRWRFLQARGVQFADIKAEYEQAKNRAAGRWIEGQVLDLAGGCSSHLPNIPEGNWGL